MLLFSIYVFSIAINITRTSKLCCVEFFAVHLQVKFFGRCTSGYMLGYTWLCCADAICMAKISCSSINQPLAFSHWNTWSFSCSMFGFLHCLVINLVTLLFRGRSVQSWLLQSGDDTQHIDIQSVVNIKILTREALWSSYFSTSHFVQRKFDCCMFSMAAIISIPVALSTWKICVVLFTETWKKLAWFLHLYFPDVWMLKFFHRSRLQKQNCIWFLVVERYGCLCCLRLACLAAKTPLWQQPDPSTLWEPSCWWMIPLLPDAIASRTISPVVLKSRLFGQGTCEVGRWMETWSQWLNTFLCMMERFTGGSRGLDVLDVDWLYHEDKVYCSAVRARSCWSIWLMCFSTDLNPLWTFHNVLLSLTYTLREGRCSNAVA